jgi:hypothetical protein
MIGKNYKPKLTPEFFPERDLGGKKVPAHWKVTGACLEALRGGIRAEDLMWLRTQIIGQAICPEWYMFPDTPEVRRVLKVGAHE